MRLPRVRFTIGRLMIVVAVAGILSAWLRMTVAGALTVAAVLILAPPTIAFLSAFFVRSGRRVLVATWVASLWPMTILWSLYAAWMVAYGFLGHPPGPADNGIVIEVLTMSVALFIITSLFSSILCFGLVIYACSANKWFAGRSRSVATAIPLLLMPLAWISVMMVWQWDPLQAAWWFVD
jgi:hypothetical protein